MADTKFKVGDRVRVKWGTGSSIRKFPVGSIGIVGEASKGTVYLGSVLLENCFLTEQVELVCPAVVKSIADPKIILQYELDDDQFEFFATEKEARKRIAELAERTDLKRNSIRLIEIRKIRTVKLGTKITISK